MSESNSDHSANPTPGEPAGPAHYAEVRGQGDHGAGPGRDAVHRADDRDGALPHRPDDVAGHLGEPHQVARLHFDQLADDLVDVAAAAEPASFAADHQHADAGVMWQFSEQVAEVGVALEGQRVQLVRPVQRDGRDAVADGEPEVLPLAGQPG